jgi:hypothetical protein
MHKTLGTFGAGKCVRPIRYLAQVSCQYLMHLKLQHSKQVPCNCVVCCRVGQAHRNDRGATCHPATGAASIHTGGWLGFSQPRVKHSAYQRASTAVFTLCSINITQNTDASLVQLLPKHLRHPPLQGGHAAANERPTLSNVALHRARQAAAAAAGSCARPQHPTLQRSASSSTRASAPLQPRLPAAPPSPPPGAQ